MNNISVPNLSFFNIQECLFHDGQICDFSTLPRPFHIFSVIINGSATFKGISGTIMLNKGDVFYIPKGETYISNWQGFGDLGCISIFFSFSPAFDPIKKFKFNMQKFCREGIADKIESMSRCNSAFEIMESFYYLCNTMFSEMSYVEICDKTTPIQTALTYLESNFEKPVSVKQLADLCYLSESRFIHLFKEIVGVTAIEYKNKLAVMHASQLLQSEDMIIEEISAECGFSSSIYFRRVFKEFTGMSPREYRKQVNSYMI